MTAEPIVFVVDDEPRMRTSLGRLLEAAGFSARLFPSAEEFLDKYEPDTPGCLVVDVRLEGQSGLELQRELIERKIHVPLIIITAYADVPSVVSAIRDGAVDFLEKPFEERRIIASVRQALADDARIRAEKSAEIDIKRRLASLTRRERQTLDLLLDGHNTKQIARRLGISPKTVDNHRNNMFRKMKADSAVELMRALRRLKQ